MAGEISRRMLLHSALYIGGGTFLVSACTGGGGGAGGGSNSPNRPGLPPIEGPTIVTDPSQVPKTFHESPDFAAQVAAGKLPPVAQRVGQDPIVIKPVHGVGKYGGELRMGMIENDPETGMLSGPSNFLYWDAQFENIVPNLALKYEMSSDFKELTLHLRRGMRWSDGQLFTADDIIFWREDLNLNSEIGYQSVALTVDGKQVDIEKVDDLTVVFRSPTAYAILPDQMAGASDIGGADYNAQFAGGGFAPKHYLSQFLPKYTSEAEANRKAKAAGFNTWVEYVLNQNTWSVNTELPVISPWVCTSSILEDLGQFVANPYSPWVDTDGNQLPYIPKASFTNTSDQQVLALNTVSGKYDLQVRGLQVQSLPVLIRNQQRSNYTVHQNPDAVLDMAIILNLALDGELGDLIRTPDFRRALSLAIDRDTVNQTYFLGTGQATCTMCPDSSVYFPGKEWRLKWATHDVAQANKLLDGIGLTKRDGRGNRLLPSGSGPIRIPMQSTNTKADFPTMGGMIVRQWQQIGIAATSDVVDTSLATERAQANKIVATVNNVYGVEEPFLSPNGFLPVTDGGVVGSTMGYRYSKWFLSGGKEGTEPPASLKLLKDAVTLYNKGATLPREQRTEVGRQIFQLHADQVWTIGVVGFSCSALGLVAARNTLGNVPARISNTQQQGSTEIALPQTLYYR